MQGMPIILDLEASGLGTNSYPIEVGIALADGRTVCYLICPHPEWTHWDHTVECLHGLCREQLVKFGRPIAEVAHSLNHLLGAQTVYSDAWGYDQSWLGLLYDYAGVHQQFRLQALQSLFCEAQFNLWNRTLDQVFTECEFTRHRASTDARAIQLAFMRSAQLAQTG